MEKLSYMSRDFMIVHLIVLMHVVKSCLYYKYHNTCTRQEPINYFMKFKMKKKK